MVAYSSWQTHALFGSWWFSSLSYFMEAITLCISVRGSRYLQLTYLPTPYWLMQKSNSNNDAHKMQYSRDHLQYESYSAADRRILPQIWPYFSETGKIILSCFDGDYICLLDIRFVKRVILKSHTIFLGCVYWVVARNLGFCFHY